MYCVINVNNLGKHFGQQSCFILFNIALSIKFNFGNSFGTYSLLPCIVVKLLKFNCVILFYGFQYIYIIQSLAFMLYNDSYMVKGEC
jgi:hypothetical protein